MAYRTGNREQISLLPASIEEYISEEDPVRVYDAFVEALDIEKLGIVVDKDKVGNPGYDPVSMLKLLVYGYSYGWRSSRKLERALHHNLSFIWLTGGLKPDHKTIANFRKNNKQALQTVLKQTARMCIELELIEGNTLFVDGSKIRGNASINQTKTKEKWEKQLKKVEENIEQLLEECDKIDEQEKGSLVKIRKELSKKGKMHKKIQGVIKKMKEEGKEKMNGTDTESINYASRQGSHTGYNAQTVVDAC